MTPQARRPGSAAGETGPGPIRINLGAGPQVHPGWISYDRSYMPLLARSRTIRALAGLARRAGLDRAEAVERWPASVRVRDVSRGIPHADGTVDAIYTSHMLEHLKPETARIVLRECHRVLREGGTLRVVVPDLEVLVRAYQSGDRAILPSKTAAMADAFIESLGVRQAPASGRALGLVRRLLRADDGGHKWMYDAESLLLRLRDAGFEDARRVAFGEGNDREAARLDNRSPFHLHVEAFKRSATRPSEARAASARNRGP